MNNNTDSELKFVPITADYPNIELIYDIRDEAFPLNERGETRNLSEWSEEMGYHFLAIEDDAVPVGFVLLYDCAEDMYLGAYLAISKQYRNKHYGTRVLKLLVEDYLNGKGLFGFVEALVPEAENYQQRLARVRFYERNGLFVLNKIFDMGATGKYQLVSTDPNATPDLLMAKFCANIPPDLLDEVPEEFKKK